MELLWGLLPLALGPLLFGLSRRLPSAVLMLDGFTFVAIGGLVLAEVLPQAFGLAGWIALPLALLGFAGPTLMERGRNRLGKQAHTLALCLALVGLWAHGFVDGMALAPGVASGQGGSALVLAVILHRLPVALTIWWLLQPRGTWVAVSVLTGLGIATVAGYFLAESVVADYLAPGSADPNATIVQFWVGAFEALVGGSLLHVVAHSSAPLGVKETSGLRWASTFGVVIAIFVLVAVGHGHDHGAHGHHHGHGHGHSHGHDHTGHDHTGHDHTGHDHTGHDHTEIVAPAPDTHDHDTHSHDGHDHNGHDHAGHDHGTQPRVGAAEPLSFRDRFLSLVLASAPALLLGYLAAGLVQAFLPKGSIRWMHRGGRGTQSLRGVLFGLPLPICSCGVIPVYRSLIKKGAPLTAALALLVSAPELSLDAVLLTVPLLGGDFALVRVFSAALVAMLVGWWVGRLATGAPPAEDEATPEQQLSAATRLRQGLQVGLGEIVDHTGPWILFGLLVAAAAHPLLEGNWLASVPEWAEIPLFALLGMPVYVCASGATPLAAVLIANGASPGAALAFLITGPATNVTTFGILRQLHDTRIALRFAISVAVLAVASGFVVNQFLDTPTTSAFLHAHGGNWLEWAALSALTLLFTLSVLRQGPRSFVGEILQFSPGDDEATPHHCHHA
ncbi:MAG: permease [Planctomycetota bacterium]